jgi:Domain of unknown function (DUF4349)
MNTSTHPVAPEEIMALLDGELRAAQAQSFSKHTETCNECQAIAEALRGASHSVVTWSVPSFQPNARFERTLTSIASEVSAKGLGPSLSPIGSFLQRRWRMVALAGSLVLLLLSVSRREAGMRRGMAHFAQSHEVDLARTDNARALPQEGRDTLSEEKGMAWPQDRFSCTDGTKLRAGTMAGAIGGVRDAEKYESAPMIARSISLVIVTKEFAAAHASLDGILARHHGYAASLAANTQQNSARSLQASLRIPALELNAAVAELKSLGRVENESQSGEEATRQHADLLARIKNSRETEQRLQEVLRTRTGKVKDVLEVEEEIARVRGEIEQMEAEQKSLEHRVDFASIDLRLTEEYKAQLGVPSPSTSTRFHNAFVTGYKDAVETVVGILLFFAEYIPSLLVWLALFFPAGWLFWRRWRRNYLLGSSVSTQ